MHFGHGSQRDAGLDLTGGGIVNVPKATAGRGQRGAVDVVAEFAKRDLHRGTSGGATLGSERVVEARLNGEQGR